MIKRYQIVKSLQEPDKNVLWLNKDNELKIYNNGDWVHVEGKPLPLATESTLGAIKVGYENIENNYKLQLDKNGNAFVSIPKREFQNNIISVTYKQLVELKNSSKLIPGMQYRIIDYITTTIQENTKSAGHQFDIIVTADFENILNEDARAIKNDTDDYFDNSNLESWELKYCLTNDSDKFVWASEDGTGVIYYMKDEWGNEASYDFKNILFLASINTENEIISSWYENMTIEAYEDPWFYTFSLLDSNTNILDASVVVDKFNTNRISNNIIKQGYLEENLIVGQDLYNILKLMLPSNIFFIKINPDTNNYNICSNNFLDVNCFFNRFGSGCYNNVLGKDCVNNFIGDNCVQNVIKNNCIANILMQECKNNILGNNCRAYDNGISNVLDKGCSSNIFGDYCFYNSLGKFCEDNFIENFCTYINLGNYCTSNYFENYCNTISFRMGDNETYDLRDYCSHNKIESGNNNLIIWNKETNGEYSNIKNINICKGISSESIEIKTLNANFKITVAKKTNGTIVSYNEADFVQ